MHGLFYVPHIEHFGIKYIKTHTQFLQLVSILWHLAVLSSSSSSIYYFRLKISENHSCMNQTKRRAKESERKNVLKCKSFEANICYRLYFYLSCQSHRKKELYYETILFRFHWFDKTHFVCWIVSDKFRNMHRENTICIYVWFAYVCVWAHYYLKLIKPLQMQFPFSKQI